MVDKLAVGIGLSSASRSFARGVGVGSRLKEGKRRREERTAVAATQAKRESRFEAKAKQEANEAQSEALLRAGRVILGSLDPDAEGGASEPQSQPFLTELIFKDLQQSGRNPVAGSGRFIGNEAFEFQEQGQDKPTRIDRRTAAAILEGNAGTSDLTAFQKISLKRQEAQDKIRAGEKKTAAAKSERGEKREEERLDISRRAEKRTIKTGERAGRTERRAERAETRGITEKQQGRIDKNIAAIDDERERANKAGVFPNNSLIERNLKSALRLMEDGQDKIDLLRSEIAERRKESSDFFSGTQGEFFGLDRLTADEQAEKKQLDKAVTELEDMLGTLARKLRKEGGRKPDETDERTLPTRSDFISEFTEEQGVAPTAAQITAAKGKFWK